MKITLSTLLCVGLFLALLSFSSASTPAPAGLPNFGTVDPGLYRGAAPEPQGLESLKKLGVQVVIDLRISPKSVKAESEKARQLGMTFVNLPMGSDPPTAKEEQTFLSLTEQAKAHPVYVHCQYGADRTGTMIGIYRRVVDHWSYTKTYTEMRHYGFKPHLTQLAAVVKSAASN